MDGYHLKSGIPAANPDGIAAGMPFLRETMAPSHPLTKSENREETSPLADPAN